MTTKRETVLSGLLDLAYARERALIVRAIGAEQEADRLRGQLESGTITPTKSQTELEGLLAAVEARAERWQSQYTATAGELERCRAALGWIATFRYSDPLRMWENEQYDWADLVVRLEEAAALALAPKKPG